MSKLQAVYDLLQDPQAWRQGEFFNDPANPTCFCILGALAHVEGLHPSYRTLDNHPDVHILAAATGFPSTYRAADIVINWNDKPLRTHQQVLDLLTDAMELATCQA